MFPQKYKLLLRQRVDFFNNARRHYSHFFTVFYHLAEDNSGKVVVIIPKKTIKLRIKRNILKRKIYNAILPLIKSGLGRDAALVIKKEIKPASLKEITLDLTEVFSYLKKND